MAMSPEQMRKNSIAQAEALRHARYAQADGSMKKMNTEPEASKEIAFQGRRVNKATAKEDADMGPQDPSPNASIRF